MHWLPAVPSWTCERKLFHQTALDVFKRGGFPQNYWLHNPHWITHKEPLNIKLMFQSTDSSTKIERSQWPQHNPQSITRAVTTDHVMLEPGNSEIFDTTQKLFRYLVWKISWNGVLMGTDKLDYCFFFRHWGKCDHFLLLWLYHSIVLKALFSAFMQRKSLNFKD